MRLVVQSSYVQTNPNPADITLARGQAVSGANFGAAVSADLKVTMTASTSGKNIIYAITVTNDGPAEAAGVTVTDALPSGVSFVSVISTQGTCRGGKSITCNLGTLASGSSATVTLRVNRTNTKNPIQNTATATATTFDIDKGDNSATATVQ